MQKSIFAKLSKCPLSLQCNSSLTGLCLFLKIEKMQRQLINKKQGKSMVVWDRTKITNLLDELNIQYSVTSHPPANTIEQISNFHLLNSEAIAKNLFLRDDKKRNYFLVVVRQDKIVNLKTLRHVLNSRPLSFASENDLDIYLGLEQGSVTPLGILNNKEHNVCLVLDEDICSFPVVGVHPNKNNATLWISPCDLQNLIKTLGNPVVSVKI